MKVNKKILQSVALVTTSLVALPAAAAVIHTDLDPDFYLHNSSYDIDLNNDSIIDFNLTQSEGYSNSNEYYSYLDFTSYNGNGATLSSPLALGDTIDGNTTFEDNDRLSSFERIYHITGSNKYGPTGYYTHDYSGGWNNVADGYLGLELSIGNNTYYGWADLDVYSDSNAYLREYAFEDWANSGIVAGATYNPDTETNTPVPEPSTLLLLGAGFAGLVALRRSKSAKK